MCRVLEVSRSGYYAWAKQLRPTSRDVADSALGDAIEEIHSTSRGIYGRPRLVAELNKKGHPVGKHRVARLMGERGVRGRVRKKFCKTTDSDHDDRIAPNLLNRMTVASVRCTLHNPGVHSHRAGSKTRTSRTDPGFRI